MVAVFAWKVYIDLAVGSVAECSISRDSERDLGTAEVRRQ